MRVCCEGRIKWARSLKYRLHELLMEAVRHSVLASLPATNELNKKYNIAMVAFASYEKDIVDAWTNHNVRFCVFLTVILFLYSNISRYGIIMYI